MVHYAIFYRCDKRQRIKASETRYNTKRVFKRVFKRVSAPWTQNVNTIFSGNVTGGTFWQ